MALIFLVNEHRLWFKSRIGFDYSEIPCHNTFCADAIFDPLRIMQVRDATLDDRFSTSPFVQGVPHMRFYAGAPLVTPEGHALGTICVVDTVARSVISPTRAPASTAPKQSRSRFLANIVSEIRTPLNAIMGFA